MDNPIFGWIGLKKKIWTLFEIFSRAEKSKLGKRKNYTPGKVARDASNLKIRTWSVSVELDRDLKVPPKIQKSWSRKQK